MSMIETRLPGRHTTPAQVVRALNRAMGRRPLARVELRYSTQAETPLHAQAAKQAIARLLQQHGQGQVEVSVRAHEGAIDDAAGEHLLRLIPQPEPEAALPAARGWQRLLQGWWPWQGAHAGGAGGPAGAGKARTEPGLQPAEPGPPPISRPQAVALLRQAVDQAAATGVTDDAGAANGSTPVAQALVIVRLPGLHAALEPLVRQDGRALAGMLRAHGLAVAPAFEVGYRFQPPQGGDGTGYANEGDLEVRLLAHPAPAERAGATPARHAAAHTAMPAGTALPAAHGTAMPAPEAQQPMLRIRVLGPADAPLPEPLELPPLPLPARLDRETLATAAAALGRPLPAEWLAGASQRCPLGLEQDPQGRVLLTAPRRVGPTGAQQPLYHDVQTRQPLPERLDWRPGQALRLCVNHPARLLIGAEGQRLPALCLELRVDGL